MFCHDFALKLGPPLGRKVKRRHADQEEALVSLHHFAIRSTELHLAPGKLRAGIVDVQAGLFKQFPARGILIALAGIETTAWRRPECLPR